MYKAAGDKGSFSLWCPFVKFLPERNSVWLDIIITWVHGSPLWSVYTTCTGMRNQPFILSHSIRKMGKVFFTGVCLFTGRGGRGERYPSPPTPFLLRPGQGYSSPPPPARTRMVVRHERCASCVSGRSTFLLKKKMFSSLLLYSVNVFIR